MILTIEMGSKSEDHYWFDKEYPLRNIQMKEILSHYEGVKSEWQAYIQRNGVEIHIFCMCILDFARINPTIDTSEQDLPSKEQLEARVESTPCIKSFLSNDIKTYSNYPSRHVLINLLEKINLLENVNQFGIQPTSDLEEVLNKYIELDSWENYCQLVCFLGYSLLEINRNEIRKTPFQKQE